MSMSNRMLQWGLPSRKRVIRHFYDRYGCLFARLSQSKFRSQFHLSLKELEYLHSKRLNLILQHGQKFIRERLAPAHPQNDGKQTPMKNHPVFVAQHATATCCRRCLQKRHHIPKGRELTSHEQTYVLNVIEQWLRDNSALSE